MKITKEHIKCAISLGMCREGIDYLQERDRTFADLYAHNKVWAVWAMVCLPDSPIDLTGLDSYDRATVMASRKDCPTEFSGMSDYDRTRVMIGRAEK